ncbi:MAG: hypothetical protein HY017_16030 [Betaproteobacteria bacterium]|nr:hypothetical protein [Betaproteobacteria bacterium]
METPVRWSLKVSKETDDALRAHLGQAGGRKGDLSKFVQQAVEARLKAERRPAEKSRQSAGTREGLAEALAEIRARTGSLSKARFEKLVTEAVAYARKRR